MTRTAAATVSLSLTLLAACGDSGTPATETSAATDADTQSTDGTAGTDGTGGTDTDPDTSTTEGGDDIWDIPYCQAVSDDKPVNGWPAAWGEFELAMLDLVNDMRSTPTDCGSAGTLPAAGPLTPSPALQCAARNHSVDMSTSNYFEHINLSGEGPGDRVAKTGYSYAVVGENIAAGLDLDSPQKAVDGLLTSDEHCANMMGPQYTEFGAGYFEGDGDLTLYWTQVFAKPN